MAKSGVPLLIRLHDLSWRLLEAADTVSRGLWSGLWLGLLSRDDLHRIDRRYYRRSRTFNDPEFTLGGLFGWETEALDRHFRNCRNLVLLGAGAGRELHALLDRGFEVDAYECNGDLREAGNQLLDEHGLPVTIGSMERDRCPPLETTYDGVILGWGMLQLIQGRDTRRALLRSLRAAVAADAPLLLSFYLMSGPDRRYRIAYRVGTAVRALLRRDRPDFGDDLSPGFAHFYTRQSLQDDLEQTGWHLRFFDYRTYPHAVATAR